MKRVIDKLLIIVCCCIFCGRTAPDVATLMMTVAFSAICHYAERSRVSCTFELLYAVLCFVFPPFVCAMPIMAYDMSKDRRMIPAAICGAAFFVSLLTHSVSSYAAVAVVCTAAVLLERRTSAYEELYGSYIKTIDSSTEVNRLLKENNLKLIENKNYEVRLATLNERNRIAREIHDNVGHLLSRSILQVQALKLIPDDELRKQGLTELGETLGSAMTSIRQSVHNLHDDSVDLKVALQEAVIPLRGKNIKVSCDCAFSGQVPNKIKTSVVSIVKEGVSNIIKYSSCDRAAVIFREHPAFYQLIIEDNGECSGKINDSGIGLSNMQARVEELGGIINITSNKKGFRIFISIRKGQS